MNKKDNEIPSPDSIPKILEIEEQEIEEKKPPNDKIIDYEIVNSNSEENTM